MRFELEDLGLKYRFMSDKEEYPNWVFFSLQQYHLWPYSVYK